MKTEIRSAVFFSRPAIWCIVILGVALLGMIDYFTGWELNFFVFYFLPIVLAGWELGLGAAIGMSILACLVWFWANSEAEMNARAVIAVWNTIIRLLSFISIGWAVARIRHLLELERGVSNQLRKSLAEVKLLEGLLPICASCKKIRNDKGRWQPVEEYVEKHSEAQFTHGLCPDCGKALLQDAGFSAEAAAFHAQSVVDEELAASRKPPAG